MNRLPEAAELTKGPSAPPDCGIGGSSVGPSALQPVLTNRSLIPSARYLFRCLVFPVLCSVEVGESQRIMRTSGLCWLSWSAKETKIPFSFPVIRESLPETGLSSRHCTASLLSLHWPPSQAANCENISMSCGIIISIETKCQRLEAGRIRTFRVSPAQLLGYPFCHLPAVELV